MAFPVVATSTTTSTQDVAPSKPTSLAVGDLIVLMLSSVAYINLNASVSAPDGTWTAIATSASSTNAMGIWYKVATSTEVAASTFGSLTGDATCGSCLRITGADATTPVILSNNAVSTSTSLSTSGITPVIQALLLNLVVGGNNNATQAFATSQAVANSNPSWTIVASVSTNIASNMSANSTPSYANETGAPGSATGNATATLNPNGKAIIAIVSVQPLISKPALITTTFSLFQPIINVVINSLLSAVFTIFAPTETTSTKWTRQQKDSNAGWTTQNKETT